MSEIKVIVKSVMLNNMFDKLVIEFEKPIQGIKRVDDKETGEVTYEKGDVTKITLSRPAVVAQLINNSDEFTDVYSDHSDDNPFTTKHWRLLLVGSTLVLNRDFIEAGKEFPDDEEGRVADHDCYSTQVKGLILGSRAQNAYNEFMKF